MDFSIFQQLGVALALASLIGLERERTYQLGNYDDFAGVRTFALIGLLGALSYILSSYSIVIFALITAGFLALVVMAYFLTGSGSSKGMTSEIAAVLVYVIGILSGMEQYLLATVVALTVLSVLYFKEVLHRWAKHLENKEFVSTIQFMIIAFVVLPLLPNQSYGPYDFFNPYVVWLMIVFISGLSFLSYIAIKAFGAKRGISVIGFLAGFISSTALAFSFSAESKKNPSVVNPYAFAVVIAGSAMFFRVLIEIYVLNRDLAGNLLIPMISMGVAGIIGSSFLWLKREKVPENIGKKMIELKSPFSIKPALKFGILFAVVMLVSKFAASAIGDRGIYLTSFISGFMDVDAITVSMANMAKDGFMQKQAIIAIMIAALTNTFSKAAIFFIFGNRKVALKISAVFAFVFLVGFGTVMLF
ncbi:MAG: MgtC/SapB family protein [Patescibacteria group bacterium]